MKSNKGSILILLALTGIIVYALFKPVWQDPNGFVFSAHGDAVKSYYNFSTLWTQQEGFKHQGINYPYGEHVQFINSHLIYVPFIDFLDMFFPLKNHSVGILNIGMLLSFFPAVLILFLIALHFKLPRWYAIFISLILVFLTPQLSRIGGHFEMMHLYIIPLYWYLLIKWKTTQKYYKYGALLILIGLLTGFLKAYFAAFYGVFLLSFLAAELIVNWNHWKSEIKTILWFAIVAILPVLIIKGVSSSTDWAENRPDNPWGFFKFHATIESVFLPYSSALKNVLDGITDIKINWESRAYVGIPASIFALAIVFYGIHALIKRSKESFLRLFPNKEFNVYLIAGSFSLLFSMCFPFKQGFEFLLEVIPPIKQFRLLGRFSWFFFYVFTMYTAYYAYKLYINLKEKNYTHLGKFLIFLVLTFWTIDAVQNIQKSTKNIFNNNSFLDQKHNIEILKNLGLNGIKPEEYQCLMFLPMANTCGDKLLHVRGMHALREAYKYAYHLNLPMLQSFSPRMPFSEAMNSIQMAADSAIYKVRVDDMNEKPILLLTQKDKLIDSEKNLLKKATMLWDGKEFQMSKLPISALNEGHRNWRKHVSSKLENWDCPNSVCSDTTEDLFIHESFGDHKSNHTFTGKGAFYKRKGEHAIFEEVLYDRYQNTEIELSIWSYVDHRKDNMPNLTIKQFGKDGKYLGPIKLDVRGSANTMGMWVRSETKLKPEKDVIYQLTVKGEYITVDDLLIRPTNEEVGIKLTNSTILFNNFKYHN